MKTEWDYTTLADAYLKRPDYSQAAIDAMISISGLLSDAKVCDVGAGVAHLTLMLAAKGFDVVAVEPNDAMRANGIQRTESLKNVRWHEGTGEATGQEEKAFDLVTFGSSFNVCDRSLALKEVARILKASGWFACMWNHRDLSDPIQKSIEEIIKNNVPGYGYGTRREDQTKVIESSGLFAKITHIDSIVYHTQSKAECVEAWRSHATLERQAGEKFVDVVNQIDAYLESFEGQSINIPYSTNIWIAQLTD